MRGFYRVPEWQIGAATWRRLRSVRLMPYRRPSLVLHPFVPMLVFKAGAR